MRTVFFDLDGTLTDPMPGITGSIRYALDKLGIEAPAPSALTWCIGPPLQESFLKLVGDEARAATALAYYRDRYGETGLYECRVYDGIPAVLESLVAAGRRLFVATSKPTVYARRVVAHFGLEPYFAAVFGAELDGVRSEKTALLGHALAATDTRPENAVMIGDRSHDMIGARRNAMAAIGVLWGYGDRQELLTAGAERLAATPEALLQALIEQPACSPVPIPRP
ncbi:MAG: HAD family hydrolase [Alphaproteobacteria bacterium]|nr:HAD family hydrolase [Alphaproteobacteria bacterium]